MGKKHTTAEERARKRARELRGFVQHAGAFFSVGLFFLIINLLTDPGNWWFYWPLLPWGIGLTIHGWNVLWEHRLFDDDWEDRQVAKRLARDAAQARAKAPRPASGTPELGEITARAAGLIDGMRASARQIPKPDARRQALDVCAAADQVLSAVGDNPTEVALARDFLNRYLEPASTIITDYARLASRNVPSAQPTLAQVEEHDLPLLTTKMNELYDRLHRGSLIDLEVAREMLSLDVADWGLEEIRPATKPAEGSRDRPVASG